MSRAKSLRQVMSLPEVLLWNALRARPDGLKFRRQHPSGPYVADFYCHQARMIVEVDGEAHNRGDAPQSDAVRNAWFEERGIHVLRIPAIAILNELDHAVVGIMTMAKERMGED